MGVKRLFGAWSTILLFLAVSLTAQPSFEDSHLPVERFGAVGDGTTDDTAALQSAITFVEGTNKTLILASTYKI